jgi:uncharacterized delta-60 repeat protein
MKPKRLKATQTRILLSIVSFGLLAGAGRASAAAGDLDPGFDGDGKVTTRVSTNDFGFDQAKAVLVQPNGRIIAVGDSDGRIALVRYLTNGVLDPAFGTGGIVTTMLTQDDYFYVNDAALQPDGKIVVVGQVNIATPASVDLFAARYLTNGVLDVSFGAGGLAIHDLGLDDSGEAVALQSDGRIVVAAYGYNFSPSQNRFAAVRLLTNGALDPTFDGDGWAEASFPGSDLARPTALALQPDGQMVIAGYSFGSGGSQFAAARFQTNGTLDGSFGVSGVVSTSLGTTNASAAGVAIQADGRIVVAGSASFGFEGWLLAARYQTNGTLDTSFDGDGLVWATNAGAAAVVRQADGKMVMAGYAGNDTGLFRFNPDGSPDAGFGTNGRVQTALSVAADSAGGVALQSDGKIVIAGSLFDPINSAGYFALARYEGDGAASSGPVLAITRTPGQVTISWTPDTGTNWVLQERTNLTLGAWTHSPSSSTNPVTVPATLPENFYRLIKP